MGRFSLRCQGEQHGTCLKLFLIDKIITTSFYYDRFGSPGLGVIHSRVQARCARDSIPCGRSLAVCVGNEVLQASPPGRKSADGLTVRFCS